MLLGCSPDLQLLAQGGATTPMSALADKQVVGLYFSAHWCPPCRGFTPKLAEVYTAIKGTGMSLEIVFVSSDRDDSTCERRRSGGETARHTHTHTRPPHSCGRADNAGEGGRVSRPAPSKPLCSSYFATPCTSY